MDPYLEPYWDDVHIRLCTEISTDLQPNLPKGLRARAAQSIRLEEPDLPPGRGHRFEGDTVLVATGPAARAAAAGAAVATVEPVVFEEVPAMERERWVQIIDTANGNRVVTVIEVLSPGNKASGDLNKRYRAKLIQYLRAGVNVVEIDLLRSSRARLRITHADLPSSRRAAYYTCVNRAVDDPWRWEVYPMPLRDPLPTVPVPCRKGDNDVPLSLQPIIDRIYVEGGHDDIDYTVPLRPRLSAADAAWAESLIANRSAGG
jgi:hypothetical protein